MHFDHPLSRSLFPPRPFDFLVIGVIGICLSGYALAFPSAPSWFTMAAALLNPFFALVFGLGGLGYFFTGRVKDPLWGGIETVSRETIEARLASAAEQLALWVEATGVQDPTASIALGIHPRVMTLSVVVRPDGKKVPSDLIDHLARQIAPDDLDARALTRAFPLSLPAGGLHTGFLATAGDISAHRRLSHLIHLTGAGFLDNTGGGTIHTGAAGSVSTLLEAGSPA